jgi:hypothetical protein
MTCATFEPLLALFAGGELPLDDQKKVEAHLASCAGCRAFAATLADNRQALRELGQEDPDPHALATVRQRVWASLESAPHALRPSRRVAHFWFAAAAVVAVVAALLPRPDRDPSPAVSVAAPRPAVSPGVPAVPPAVTARAESIAEPIAKRPREGRRRAPRDVSPRVTPRPFGGSGDLVIKLVTGDPDIVIYWLVEQNGGRS